MIAQRVGVAAMRRTAFSQNMPRLAMAARISTTQARTSSSSSASYVPCHPISASFDATAGNELEARGGCSFSRGRSSRASIESIKNDMQKNLPDAQYEVKHRGTLQFDKDKSRICVYNGFFFDNTHVTRQTIAGAVDQILSKCCDGDVCGTFRQQIQGDSGLKLDVFIGDLITHCDS
ncbi:hypothetical protein NQ176_g506 [Zarea fungicola]|uniref:Uncharacterized protein n=1 Tax=Zarea fungicola TaxID=93591 RepID=A0ACC1NYY0_9HYPO|nr:hypothetical protein NQ176_g506 [Lecanicillium fungicola]